MLELGKFSSLVEEVLDMDSVDSLEFLIKGDFDEGLADIGERMKELEKQMSKQLSRVTAFSPLPLHITATRNKSQHKKKKRARKKNKKNE